MRLLAQALLPLTLAAGLLSAGSLLAQEVDNRPNIYIGGMKYLFDNDRNQDNDTGYYFGGELPLTQRWSGTLEYWDVDTDNELNGGEHNLRHYRIGGNYHLNQISVFQPYLSAGIGYLDLEPSYPAPEASEGSFDLGVGVKHFINDNFMIRADAKTIYAQDEHHLDFAVGLSVGYVFGAGPTRTPPAPDPAEIDSDGDGVNDAQDQCANTPVGAQVDARGCERDSDSDGVVDSRDDCANTSRELAVDGRGCPILDVSQVRQEIQVNFDFNAAEIRPEYEDEIEEFAEFMQQYANTTVTIEGHSDNTGPEEYNQGLSERRAEAVRDALIEKGISPDRLSVMGYGESNPIADNSTRAGREQNRRIVAEVTVEVEEQRRR